MTPTYRLIILGRTGMYTCGDLAATPDLARIARGGLIRTPADRLGLVAMDTLPGTWTDSAGYQHRRYSDPVLIDAESAPGEWTIGQ